MALPWDSQLAAVPRSAFNQLRLFTELHPYLDEVSHRILVRALVLSQIDYCKVLSIYRAFPEADLETTVGSEHGGQTGGWFEQI